MIGLLVLVEVLNIWRQNIASPLQIKHIVILAIDHVEAGKLSCIYDSIVNVCIVEDLECHEQVLDLFFLVLTDSVAFPFDFNVGRVLEESSRRSVLENRLQERSLSGLGLEDAVGEATLLSANEIHVQRVIYQESVDLFFDLVL